MLRNYEVSEELLPRQWFRQNWGVPEIGFELLEGPFTFLGPNELLLAMKNVKEWETLVG